MTKKKYVFLHSIYTRHAELAAKIGTSLKILRFPQGLINSNYKGEIFIIPLHLLLMSPCAALEESLHTTWVQVKYKRCSSDLEVKKKITAHRHSISAMDKGLDLDLKIIIKWNEIGHPSKISKTIMRISWED